MLFSFVNAFLHLWLIKQQSLSNRQPIIFIMSSFFFSNCEIKYFAFSKCWKCHFRYSRVSKFSMGPSWVAASHGLRLCPYAVRPWILASLFAKALNRKTLQFGMTWSCLWKRLEPYINKFSSINCLMIFCLATQAAGLFTNSEHFWDNVW